MINESTIIRNIYPTIKIYHTNKNLKYILKSLKNDITSEISNKDMITENILKNKIKLYFRFYNEGNNNIPLLHISKD